MKRAIIFLIIAIITLCSFSSQLLASPEGAIARLGTGRVNAVAFSPNVKMLAVGAEYGVYIYDPFSLAQIGYFITNSYITSVVFNPDGSLLASGSLDNTIKLWDVKSRNLITTFSGHTSYVNSVAFSPDGNLLASASSDETTKLWDVRNHSEVATLKGHSDHVISVAFSPDGSLLASGSDGTIILWDVRTRTNIATLEKHNFNYVLSVTFSPDGNLLASGSEDGTIKLWDVRSRTNIATFKGNSYGVNSVAFSPDGNLLASGSEDGTIILWDMKPYIKDQSDSIPPSTAMKLSENQDAKGVYTSDVTVTLIATDNLSEVKQTTYKIGDGLWQVYSSPFVIKESATISYKSEDNAGNVETEKTQQIVIENVYPYDVNQDGIVNILNLVIVSKNFDKSSQGNAKADVNKDGVVDILDLNIVSQHFGKSSP